MNCACVETTPELALRKNVTIAFYYEERKVRDCVVGSWKECSGPRGRTRHDCVESGNAPKWVWDRLLEHGIMALSDKIEQDALCVILSRSHSHDNTGSIKSFDDRKIKAVHIQVGLYHWALLPWSRQPSLPSHFSLLPISTLKARKCFHTGTEGANLLMIILEVAMVNVQYVCSSGESVIPSPTASLQKTAYVTDKFKSLAYYEIAPSIMSQGEITRNGEPITKHIF